ncbi:MAG: TonB-dependent receptor [Bacteroidota bacterium]|nr:TonB-dependent receptor [Bacteroidota bacterium]
MRKTITLLCILSLCPHCIKSQVISNTNPIEDLFLKQSSYYPQEKIYVHTDKTSYVSGEPIWLRVHLVDALLLKQANASRYVYVELLNPLSVIVKRVMLRPDSMGYFYGNVKLDESLPEGAYMLRVYTKFMQNQGEDYFFRKSVYVIDPLSAEIAPEINFHVDDHKIKAEAYLLSKPGNGLVVPDECKLFMDGNAKGKGQRLSFNQDTAHFSFDLKNDQQPVILLQTTYKGRIHNRFFTVSPSDRSFNVSFFPEGGHAPEQTDIQIAFKALNRNGLHDNVKGTVYDDTGRECVSFESQHLGMGQFRMYYTPGRTYYAICTNEQNISQRFELPAPVPQSVALKTAWNNDNLQVTLSKTPGYVLPLDVYLVAHMRGAVLYSQPWDDKKVALRFDKDFFPAGIVHFLLIDKDKNILSERLAFSTQGSTFAQTDIKPDKQSYKTRDKINLTIQVTDENQSPLAGNFSLSVVDKRDVAMDTTSNIISTLLLTSELKGYIESPLSYLQKDSKKASAALDVLMMTQGWRRYDVLGILKGNIQKDLKYPVESNREFSGKVSGIFSALKDGKLSLLAIKDSLIGTAFTSPDKDGKFVFKNIDYPDSTRYIVQAITKKGSNKAFIEMDSIDVFPKVGLPPIPVNKTPRFEDSYLKKTNEKYVIEKGVRVINLAEVEVRGQRSVRPQTESPYYSVASSFVLSTEEIEKANFLTVFDLLRRLPGVTTSGNEVFYRQATPLLVLDNIPSENFDYSMLNVNDISDAFVTPAVVAMPMLGPRAANGAIIINTKRGFVQKNKLNKNMQVLNVIGYQQRAEFYSPAYQTEQQRNSPTPDLRSTIYWKPNIQTDSTGTVKLSFYSADGPSQYGIVLEGVSSFGHLINSSKEITVVKQ